MVCESIGLDSSADQGLCIVFLGTTFIITLLIPCTDKLSELVMGVTCSHLPKL